MPFNGVGLFTRVYQWVNDEVLGLNVDATRTDTDSNDIAAGLSNCVTRDGQSPWLGNLPAGTYKITGLGTGSATTDSVNYGQVFNSPTFITPRAATSPAASDNSTLLATTAMVQQVAFAASLPAQPGDTISRNLTTLSGIALWDIERLPRSVRTSNTIFSIADGGHFIDITSGTFSQTFTAAATLADGWWVFLRNSGTGNITLDPNAAELIDGLASYVMYPGEARFVQCDGSAFTSVVIHPFNVAFTANGTFTKPPGYAYFDVIGWSGGNSGQRTNNVAVASVGGGGAGCGRFNILASTVGTTETITIGSGGTAVTTVATGNVGTSTTLGSLVSIYPGATWSVGGSIVSGLKSNSASTGFTGVGYEGGESRNGVVCNAIWGGGGTAADGAANSGSAVWGAGAGGSMSAAAAVKTAGTSIYGGNGGAASSASNGTDGVAPGGAGGSTQTGTQSGAGARGELRIQGGA